MSGGSKTQTTTTNNAPWAAAQPALKLGLNQAQNLFKADPTGKNSVYTGSTVVPWAQQTQQGMGQIQSNAAANAGGNGTSAQYRDIIYQGGFNDPQRNAAGVMQGMMNNPTGLNAAQTQALQGVQGLARDPFNSYQSAALANTQETADSDFNINRNPAFQKVLQQAQGAARDSVNLSAGSAGRYGGAIHQGNLASEVGDLTSRMVGQEYNNWQNRRDTANQNLFNMGQAGRNTQQNANNAAFNMGQTGMGNRTGAAQNLYQMGQGAIGNLSTAYQGLQQPAQDLMQVGAMQEDLATRQMNDKLRVFNEQQNAPWQQLGRLNAIASGTGQLGGTQTQSQPGQNPFLTALGYGTTGLGLLGGLF